MKGILNNTAFFNAFGLTFKQKRNIDLNLLVGGNSEEIKMNYSIGNRVELDILNNRF